MKNIQFGTDGWRGLLDEEFNEDSVVRVAQAFSGYLKRKSGKGRVVIGYDGRKNSGAYADLFARVLLGNGMDVILSDRVVPTPVVSFACRQMHCDAGVMITASHNPPRYNGIKFKAAEGSPFFTEETAKVESLMDALPVVLNDSFVERSDITGDYLAHLERLINWDSIAEAGLAVAIDSMSGAGGTLLQNLLTKHGIASQTIFGTAEADFAGRLAEPTESNLKPLAELLMKGSFSLGLATDGDGDRLGVMTNGGQWMNVQETILSLGRYYSKQRGVAGPVVKTASVTDKLLQVFSPGNVFDVQVGFKYVAEAMIHRQASFGAEESGGFGFREHLPERDGLFSGLIFLEMLAKSGHHKLDSFIGALRSDLGQIHYDRVDLESSDPARHVLLSGLAANLPGQIAGWKVTHVQPFSSSRGLTNGLKIRLKGDARWLLLRISETEPMARIYAEGQNNDEVDMLLDCGIRLLCG